MAIQNMAELAACALAVAALYYTGKGQRIGPICGVASFVPWQVYSVMSGSWFLFGLNIIFLAVHANNLRLLWGRSARGCG